MNGTNTDILNPFGQMIADAADIRNALHTAVTDLELAIEAEAAARRTAKETRETYEAAEAEFEAEAMNRDRSVVNGDGKAKSPTVDQIKALVKAELAQARSTGALAQVWAMANAASYEAEDAKMALEQAAKRFRATESAADLTAAMLRAATR